MHDSINVCYKNKTGLYMESFSVKLCYLSIHLWRQLRSETYEAPVIETICSNPSQIFNSE